ncbi:F-box/LRR-repeat protein 20 isoform X2 [Histomonas meleagridis]|uniref:F-box/LRR-repeat protein 20 isoform X2 n=1 Tax=Histomonas meleagridis TaxID=135588 RepID=UPI003559EB66|nr:F-box/LRR-repeat protein 20 isoform X2 [Histomonas meleagridis]KAH0798099.1 F-box/LRR-repeat protein 20 isoform X2 [Histomonas meleagridis]
MHRLCHTPQLWSSIHITDAKSLLTPFSIFVLCGKGRFIQNLSIDLRHNDITDAVLFCLASSCTSLVSLSLYKREDSILSTTRINTFPVDVLFHFLSSSKFIRSLTFTDSVFIDDSHLVKLLPRLQMIQEINLSGCSSITDSILIRLSQQCPSLQILDISRLSITGRCLESLFRYCSYLRVLRANYCLSFQSDSFDVIPIDCLNQLTELSIVQTPVSLEQALNFCTSLRALLATESLHDSILIPFLIRNHSLEVLHMGVGCRVTISSLLTALQTCGPTLQSLTFHPFKEFGIPSDETIRIICERCPRLRNLSFACSREISTFWVIQLLDRLKIETLALFGWENANSSTLRIISQHVKYLKVFCTSECVKVTANGIVDFVSNCPSLETVKFNETGANVGQDGRLDPIVVQEIRKLFPEAMETTPGTIVLK